ncbi:hypothetical protein GA0116948_104149 [Chitinophaga costaii]|uniref:Uncharacterized protein n=1 Tax=Chitinophaga costaii TaxID=1335309 RepID=A0A1C4CJ17_9BACT|nr:hypothetical protein DCM91_07540 [Chitinophaga costaii]SCC19075.1 hypothetical protein GA0116948_104149 [Chitinophaga costaii]
MDYSKPGMMGACQVKITGYNVVVMHTAYKKHTGVVAAAIIRHLEEYGKKIFRKRPAAAMLQPAAKKSVWGNRIFIN